MAKVVLKPIRQALILIMGLAHSLFWSFCGPQHMNGPLCANMKHWHVELKSSPSHSFFVSELCALMSKSSCMWNQTLNQLRNLMWLNTSETCQWWDWAVRSSVRLPPNDNAAWNHRLSISSSCFVLTSDMACLWTSEWELWISEAQSMYNLSILLCLLGKLQNHACTLGFWLLQHSS